ncbi:hypothetical protein SOP70_08070 [Lactiplantibacillus plantarum]|uniref:hypothetical protein n=1 Tax=Lactiplantibacillus plantarum TaxID=1590 RepID=UPI002A7631C9|nr:hypothetical protein [Lactiplantibacillus plantarum]MDY2577338.1 hypothetical protein [Lactiplantibacillus plantarum]
MKVKTFWTMTVGDPEFDDDVNEFIKDKEVIQVITGDTMLPYDELTHTLTVLYKAGE